MTPEQAHGYTDSVLEVLDEHFKVELADAVTRDVVTSAVSRQALKRSDSFEVIVDAPYIANWRLKPAVSGRRVRLACYRLNESAADRRREEAVNTALRAIPL